RLRQKSGYLDVAPVRVVDLSDPIRRVVCDGPRNWLGTGRPVVRRAIVDRKDVTDILVGKLKVDQIELCSGSARRRIGRCRWQRPERGGRCAARSPLSKLVTCVIAHRGASARKVSVFYVEG